MLWILKIAAVTQRDRVPMRMNDADR
jgi:hypothetical protein